MFDSTEFSFVARYWASTSRTTYGTGSVSISCVIAPTLEMLEDGCDGCDAGVTGQQAARAPPVMLVTSSQMCLH